MFPSNEPLPSLAGRADVEGYWAVFWWHDTPLGHLAIPSFQLPDDAPLRSPLGSRGP